MYLTGGATAVLEGWRPSTVDVDEVFDFDPYSQTLSKLERGFDLDLRDVAAMVRARQVDPTRLLELFAGVEPELFRFPAVDPAQLRRAVENL